MPKHGKEIPGVARQSEQGGKVLSRRSAGPSHGDGQGEIRRDGGSFDAARASTRSIPTSRCGVRWSCPTGPGRACASSFSPRARRRRRPRDAGADFVGADDLVQKIQGGWMEFDKAVATPDMMGAVGKIGKLLGPRGLMPNPKVGTVTFDVARAVRDLKGGKVEFRVDKTATLAAGIGKASFGKEKIKENFLSFFEAIVKSKPSGAKGTYIRTLTLSTTMGPGIRLNTSVLLAAK